MSYLHIKNIAGRKYLYEQHSQREGEKVTSISRYICPIEPIYAKKTKRKKSKKKNDPVKQTISQFTTTVRKLTSTIQVFEQPSIFGGEFERVRMGYADKNGLGICYVECFGNKKTVEGHLTIHAGSEEIHKHGICKALSDRDARAIMRWAKNKPIDPRLKPDNPRLKTIKPRNKVL
jgi:hypothetical protein